MPLKLTVYNASEVTCIQETYSFNSMRQETSREKKDSVWNLTLYSVSLVAMLLYKCMETRNKKIKCFVCCVDDFFMKTVKMNW